MISVEEKYTDERGYIDYRTVEMNYTQVVQASPAPDFVKAYLKKWLGIVQAYEQDSDPKESYSSFNISDLIGERGWETARRLRNQGVLTEEEGQKLYLLTRDIDNHMLDRMREHFQKHEFEPFPVGTAIDIAPFAPSSGLVVFTNNNNYLAQKQQEKAFLIVAPLILTWEYWENPRTTRYSVNTPNGWLLHQSAWVKAANRFRDPLKRHAAAIGQTKALAALTDWERVENNTLSYKQKRSLAKEIRENFKEGWGA